MKNGKAAELELHDLAIRAARASARREAFDEAIAIVMRRHGNDWSGNGTLAELRKRRDGKP